jgi:hypothetical protein
MQRTRIWFWNWNKVHATKKQISMLSFFLKTKIKNKK